MCLSTRRYGLGLHVRLDESRKRPEDEKQPRAGHLGVEVPATLAPQPRRPTTVGHRGLKDPLGARTQLRLVRKMLQMHRKTLQIRPEILIELCR